MALTNLIPWKRERKVPVKREESHPIETFQRDMNRFFDEFFTRGFGLTPFDRFDEGFEGFSPHVDVVEGDKDITIAAELPGMDEKDIEVSLSQGVLTISGEKKEEKEDKGKNYYRMERSYGSFRRSVALPCEVNADKVAATYKQGVLTITLPKITEGRERKKIAITAK